MHRKCLVSFLLLAGCADRLPLVGAPCPCADGTTCDPETNQCVGAPSTSFDAAPFLDSIQAQPPLDGPPAPEAPSSAACKALGIGSLAEFETQFIAPRCGRSKCHGTMSVFPPRNLDMPGMIRTRVVGQQAALNCKNDFYVNTSDYTKSYMLHKVKAQGDTLPCPSDPFGKSDAGGTRMPNMTDMPTIVGPRLTETELQCFTWWVHGVSQL